jgi:hypothetical protein
MQRPTPLRQRQASEHRGIPLNLLTMATSKAAATVLELLACCWARTRLRTGRRGKPAGGRASPPPNNPVCAGLWREGCACFCEGWVPRGFGCWIRRSAETHTKRQLASCGGFRLLLQQLRLDSKGGGWDGVVVVPPSIPIIILDPSCQHVPNSTRPLIGQTVTTPCAVIGWDWVVVVVVEEEEEEEGVLCGSKRYQTKQQAHGGRRRAAATGLISSLCGR